MQPHPEGGHFVEVYRSSANVQPLDARAVRPLVTTIYFLLQAGDISRWHRVRGSDEVWHFYEGDPLELLTAGTAFDRLERHQLGPVSDESDESGEGNGQRPVHVVQSDVWQAARSTGAYTLVGCTVGPGFDFADFQMLRDLPGEAAAALRSQPDAAPFV